MFADLDPLAYWLSVGLSPEDTEGDASARALRHEYGRDAKASGSKWTRVEHYNSPKPFEELRHHVRTRS